MDVLQGLSRANHPGGLMALGATIGDSPTGLLCAGNNSRWFISRLVGHQRDLRRSIWALVHGSNLQALPLLLRFCFYGFKINVPSASLVSGGGIGQVL